MGLDTTTVAAITAAVTLAVVIVAIVAASAGACGDRAAAAVHDVELALGSDTLVTYDQAAALKKSRMASSATEEEEEAAAASPEGKADRCALCLSEYAGGHELVRVVPACGHFFHAKCNVDWWLLKRGTCPICRGGVRPAMPECPPLPARAGGGGGDARGTS